MRKVIRIDAGPNQGKTTALLGAMYAYLRGDLDRNAVLIHPGHIPINEDIYSSVLGSDRLNYLSRRVIRVRLDRDSPPDRLDSYIGYGGVFVDDFDHLTVPQQISCHDISHDKLLVMVKQTPREPA